MAEPRRSDLEQERGTRITGWVIRAFFLLVSAGTGWHVSRLIDSDPFWTILGAIGLFLIVVALESCLGAVMDLSALVFGVVVGVLLGYMAYFLAILFIDPDVVEVQGPAIRLVIICLCTYLAVSVIFRTRGRFNFIIPYVEFRRERRGPSPLILDTSAIVDGRIARLGESGLLDSSITVPRFVLEELHALADSADREKRQRGRRGLDVLHRLRENPLITVEIDESPIPGVQAVDDKLVKLTNALGGRLLTGDYNLCKVAEVEKVPVINLHLVAEAFRPEVLPGEELTLRLAREGEQHGQAVGFLGDGTMVVVAEARGRIGQDLPVVVTNLLQQTSGRIIFARLRDQVNDANSNRGK